MITFLKLGKYGRLGNQMFQYAATKAAALNSNSKFYIPIENNDLKNIFSLDCKFLSLKETSLFKNITIYNEKSFNYESSFKNIKDNTSLEGYFQSERYFKEHEATIRRDFSFKVEIFNNTKKYIDAIKLKTKKQQAVSIHVRRGDYLNLAKHHPPCQVDYYNQAIKNFHNCNFIVFSDDIDWCKNNICGDNIFYSELKNSYYDLCAMSICDHNIIANSTFSWWGAWLNNNKNKIVIAPKKWFGEEYNKYSLDDLYCKNWIKI